MEDAIDEETLNNTRENLSEIHRRIEDILYNARLVVVDEITPEKLAKINNIVLELEKSTINLGAEVADGK
jgi:metallo-beta-lactamase family protein